MYKFMIMIRLFFDLSFHINIRFRLMSFGQKLALTGMALAYALSGRE